MTTSPEAVLHRHDVTVTPVFIPLSQSRNAHEKDRLGNPRLTLNWRVTVQRKGRDVLTVEYSAGMAHCPSYAKPVPAHWNRQPRFFQTAVCAWECENGFEAAVNPGSSDFTKKRRPIQTDEGTKHLPVAILPKAQDVLYSLIKDADVLDYATFEDWALELGYDIDSRAAEKIYRTCLDIALKLRAGIGDTALSELCEAFQDY
jgi:hypothetical protein